MPPKKFFYNLFTKKGTKILAEDLVNKVVYGGRGVFLVDSEHLKKKSRDIYRVSRIYYKKAENAKDPRLQKAYKQLAGYFYKCYCEMKKGNPPPDFK